MQIIARHIVRESDVRGSDESYSLVSLKEERYRSGTHVSSRYGFIADCEDLARRHAARDQFRELLGIVGDTRMSDADGLTFGVQCRFVELFGECAQCTSSAAHRTVVDDLAVLIAAQEGLYSEYRADDGAYA